MCEAIKMQRCAYVVGAAWESKRREKVSPCNCRRDVDEAYHQRQVPCSVSNPMADPPPSDCVRFDKHLDGP